MLSWVFSANRSPSVVGSLTYCRYRRTFWRYLDNWNRLLLFTRRGKTLLRAWLLSATWRLSTSSFWLLLILMMLGWFYYNLETGIEIMTLLPEVPYAILPTFDFGATSRQAEEYFGSMAQPLESIRSAVDLIAIMELTEPITAPIIPSFLSLSLGPLLSRPSMPSSANIGITDRSPSPSAITTPLLLCRLLSWCCLIM